MDEHANGFEDPQRFATAFNLDSKFSEVCLAGEHHHELHGGTEVVEAATTRRRFARFPWSFALECSAMTADSQAAGPKLLQRASNFSNDDQSATGITVRQTSQALFRQHRPNSDMTALLVGARCRRRSSKRPHAEATDVLV
jgi:hypothetical protein